MRIVPSNRELGLAPGKRAGWPGVFWSVVVAAAAAVAVGALCRTDRKSQMNLPSDRIRGLRFRCVGGRRNDSGGRGGATSRLVGRESYQVSWLSL